MRKKYFFSLDLKKSEKMGVFFIELFYSFIKVNKNNQYSGILKKYTKKEFNFLTEQERKFLKETNLDDRDNFFVLNPNSENLEKLNLYLEKIPIFIKINRNLFLVNKFINIKSILKEKNIELEYNQGIVYTKISLEKRSCELIKIEPKVIIKIKKILNEEIFFFIEFEYESLKINPFSNNLVINNTISRNLIFEQKILKIILDFQIKKISKNLFSGNFFILEEIQESIKDVEFYYYEDNTINRVYIPKFVKFEKNISENWLSFDIIYNFSGEDESLINQINLYKEKWTILKNNKFYLLPSKLKKTLNQIKNEGMELKLPWYKKGFVENIFERYNQKIEERYPYKQIQLTLNDSITKLLKEYQITGIKWLKYLYLNNLNGCLADDMGLGKTLQILSFLSEKSVEACKVLIICPKILIKNWSNEVEKFGFDFNIIHIFTSEDLKKIKINNDKKNIIIMSFGIIRNSDSNLDNLDFLIIDEAQNIKNTLTISYKSINLLKAKHKILLTGTPLENNLEELVGLIKFLNPILLKNIYSYKKEKIKEILSPFILRRTKEDVLTLPEKKINDIFLEMLPLQEKLYFSLMNKFQLELKKSNRYKIIDNSLFLKMLLILRQTCCHTKLLQNNLNPTHIDESAKFNRLKILISEAYNKKSKIVIFSQFTSMLKIILDYIKKENYHYYYLDGTTKKRNELIQEYEKDKKFSIFLISLKAGGAGITLISSQIVVLYDPWWNPAIENQAIDRIHRIGQNKNVEVYRLYTKQSVEEKIYKLKETKNELFKEILDNKNQVVNILSLRKILFESDELES